MLLVYGFQCQEKIYDLKKLKTFRRWVFMDFHGTKKLSLMVSHDLWTQNRNIIFHGIWNMYFQKISIPPHPPQKTLWFAPPPPSPKEVWNGDFAKHPLEMNPPSPLEFPMISIGGGGVWIFYVISRLPCTCQWTVDSIGKSGFCSKSQNPKVDFKVVFNVFKGDFKKEIQIWISWVLSLNPKKDLQT